MTFRVWFDGLREKLVVGLRTGQITLADWANTHPRSRPEAAFLGLQYLFILVVSFAESDFEAGS